MPVWSESRKRTVDDAMSSERSSNGLLLAMARPGTLIRHALLILSASQPPPDFLDHVILIVRSGPIQLRKLEESERTLSYMTSILDGVRTHLSSNASAMYKVTVFPVRSEYTSASSPQKARFAATESSSNEASIVASDGANLGTASSSAVVDAASAG